MNAVPLHHILPDSEEMLGLLWQLQADYLRIFDQMRPGQDPREAVGVNAKGDDRKPCDIAADAWIRELLSNPFKHRAMPPRHFQDFIPVGTF